uniref:Uncharacterized protein n=1 Tax=Anguilla anguilla TaxID=7936 RepID=A0A0E9TVA9_ANGAN
MHHSSNNYRKVQYIAILHKRNINYKNITYNSYTTADRN